MGGFVYRPRGAVVELFGARDREVLIEGPAGTGKTRGVCEKVFALACKYARSRHLLCRKTRVSMTQSVLPILEGDVFGPHAFLRAGASKSHRTAYRLPNGSEIVMGGLDNADRIMSSEYDTISVFEATETVLDDWEKLLSRLRAGNMPYQQAIADCNPASPSHWLNQRAAENKMRRLLSRHRDNPVWFDDDGRITERGRFYIGEVLESLSGPRRERLLHGKWCQAEGLVYERWDAAVHMVDPFPIPADWKRIRSIDFGFVNPAVCQWWAIDGDGRMYLYRELYVSKWTTDQLAREIVRLSAGEKYLATVADHDAGDRAILERCGVATVAAKKDVLEGINRVQERLTVAGDGKPRLFVLRDALVFRDQALHEARKPCGFAEEVEGYVWSDKSRKDEPVKLDDHSADCARYAVMCAEAPRVFMVL